MKFMDAKTLRGQSEKRLTDLLRDSQDHLQELRFKLASNQLKNVREFRKTRKQIARIKTILREPGEESTK